jgi:hypothetical protein
MVNRSTSGLLLSKAIDGFIRYKVVEGLSDTTIVSYEDHLGRFLDYTGDTASIRRRLRGFSIGFEPTTIPGALLAAPSHSHQRTFTTTGSRSSHSSHGPRDRNSYRQTQWKGFLALGSR